jgi:hypothetical protein
VTIPAIAAIMHTTAAVANRTDSTRNTGSASR